MNRPLAAAPFLFVGLVACASTPRTARRFEPALTASAPGARDTTASTAAATCSPSATPSPTLVRRLEQMAQQLQRDGVSYQGIAAAGFITPGTNVTTPVDVPAGTCLSIVALASSAIRDLDAHVFSPEGDLIVEDIEPDPHPTVQLCATEARRVYHVMEAYDDGQGSRPQGAYAVATFTSDRQGLDRVARAMGGRPGMALSAGSTASEAERRLAELREGIQRRGFFTVGEVTRAPFAAAGVLRVPLPVLPDRCYTLAALAEGSVSNADLSVLDANGEEIARDVRPERDAFVQLCPASAATLSVEVRGAPGPGAVLLQTFAADAATVGGANSLWLGERTAWSASAVPLSEATESARQALGAQGFTTAGTARTLSLSPGESREIALTLEPGRCTALVGVPGRGLGRLQLGVHDREGDFLARGIARSGASIAVLCPPARETVSVRVRAEVGSGEAVLQSFTGAPSPAWAHGLDRVALSEALATQAALPPAGWQAEGSPERIRLGARAIRSREFDLPAGVCTRFVVSSGRGLPRVALALRNASGQTVTETSGEGTATVTRCSTESEHVRLEASIDPPSATEFDGVLARFRRAGGP